MVMVQAPLSNFNSPAKVCQAQQVCGEMMCPLCTTEVACKTKVLVTMMHQAAAHSSVNQLDNVASKWGTAMLYGQRV